MECPGEGRIVLTVLVCVLTLTVTVKGSISEEQHYQLFKDGSLSGTLSKKEIKACFEKLRLKGASFIDI